jgi:hypothetical protein
LAGMHSHIWLGINPKKIRGRGRLKIKGGIPPPKPLKLGYAGVRYAPARGPRRMYGEKYPRGFRCRPGPRNAPAGFPESWRGHLRAKRFAARAGK